MPMPDLNDPRERRKLAQHYRKIARQAQRNRRIEDFGFKPRFAALDMVLLALIAAVLGVIVGFIVR